MFNLRASAILYHQSCIVYKSVSEEARIINPQIHFTLSMTISSWNNIKIFSINYESISLTDSVFLFFFMHFEMLWLAEFIYRIIRLCQLYFKEIKHKTNWIAFTCIDHFWSFIFNCVSSSAYLVPWLFYLEKNFKQFF